MEKSAHFNLLQIVLEAVVEASEAILTIYNGGFSAKYKIDGSPVTQADFASNEILEKHLERTHIPILSEENEHASYEERKGWKQSWCVDPLDGTKEFLKKNDEFAICVALIENKKPILGIIASPVERKILIGGREVPAAVISFDSVNELTEWQFLEAKPSLNDPLVIAGSRTPNAGASLTYINELKEKFGELTYLRKGSALKFFDLALGIADIYPRFAPTMEWDIAAGQAIMEALGGQVVHPQTNKSLEYNKESLYNSFFAVKTKAFLDAEKNG